LPVSAQECAASATMDADPVSTEATDLATAMSPLATRATSTVTRVPPASSFDSSGAPSAMPSRSMLKF